MTFAPFWNEFKRRAGKLLLGLLTIFLPTATRGGQHDEQHPKVARVYILAGQSNMVGSGQASELEPALRKPIDGVFLWDRGPFEALNPDKLAKKREQFGPEVGFAKCLRASEPNGPPLYLVKFAIGGQPLDAGWDKPSADGGGWVGPEPGPGRATFYPGTSAEDPNVGLHYRRLHERVAAALKELRMDGQAPRLEGIVWMQGEADAKHEVSAGRYDRSLALLKQRLESDFADGNNVPLVFGQVLPHEPALPRFTHRDLIRRRMAEADWRSGSDRAIANGWMVPTDGMDLLNDTVHYSMTGQMALGTAMGQAMLAAQHAKAEAPQP